MIAWESSEYVTYSQRSGQWIRFSNGHTRKVTLRQILRQPPSVIVYERVYF
jgi:hypothetical protein